MSAPGHDAGKNSLLSDRRLRASSSGGGYSASEGERFKRTRGQSYSMLHPRSSWANDASKSLGTSKSSKSQETPIANTPIPTTRPDDSKPAQRAQGRTIQQVSSANGEVNQNLCDTTAGQISTPQITVHHSNHTHLSSRPRSGTSSKVKPAAKLLKPFHSSIAIVTPLPPALRGAGSKVSTCGSLARMSLTACRNAPVPSP